MDALIQLVAETGSNAPTEVIPRSVRRQRRLVRSSAVGFQLSELAPGGRLFQYYPKQ